MTLHAASAHAQLHRFTTRLEGDKHLFPPQDLDINLFVEAQVQGVQDRGNAANAAPVPLPHLGTILLQTPAAPVTQVQPATERPHAERQPRALRGPA